VSRVTSEGQSLWSRERGPEGRGYYLVEERRSRGLSPALVVGGLAVLGLGALAWYYLGPDIRRYMKIRSM
jgi:hypothetical protein